ncbi:hypothetical protein EG349_01020 [Chryseobacterium shandongense]|uniref:Uncharacterized protein n=1 Tax=Chryseobacterium shandongense TaxID=1493872 RepID=A0AAD0YA92_9FLAO|nr:hypothetical protein [Chryseobacterium shandongense]AZA85470.1 hypothetical protein EG349_01020 [Chryseobacterium shandongense]AZA97577.1 hypothetical protein EG353_19490 [Chryseobacterium shandongense]
MKLKATIVEETSPNDNSVIVTFEGDKDKKHFEVKCSFNPFVHKMRKWDSWEMIIKWDSEIFKDEKSGSKSYFTYLLCDKASEINSPYGKKD